MVEIIEFKNPVNERLHITNIEWNNNTTDPDIGLINLLKNKISHYGLVHSVIAKEVPNESATSNTSTSWYAYIDMYSDKAIQKAYLHLKTNLIINSKHCKIRKVKGRQTNYPLAKDKCETLANYYLGFNGWTTELLYHKHESSSGLTFHGENIQPLDKRSSKINIEGRATIADQATSTDIQTEKYASAIRICIPRTKNGELSVEGVGIGTSDWNLKSREGKGKALAFASKQSRTSALQDAFSKLLLIVLNDGEKVTAEVNLQKADPFAYNPVWDLPIITVNEVSYNADGQESEMRDSDFDGCFTQLNKL